MEELEVKKLKTIKTLFVVLSVVLTLGICSLSYYIYITRNNVKEDTKEVEEVDVSKLTEEIDYIYLLNKESKNVNELSPQQILTIMFFSLRDTSDYRINLEERSKNVMNNVRDGNGVEYPNYTLDKGKVYCENEYIPDITLGDIKSLLKGWGVSIDTIEKTDNSFLGCLGTLWGYGTYVFDGDKIKEQIKDIFDIESNIFNESFHYTSKENITNTCGIFEYIYEKNIDKLFINVAGGCTAPSVSWNSIIKEYKEVNLYKMDVLNYFVGPEFFENDSFPKEVNIYNIEDKSKSVGTITIDSYKDTQNLGLKLIKYKDKLDNYTLTFKKEGDNYQFVSIDYKG